MGEYQDKIEGEAKDLGGKPTGNQKMEWEGKGQQVTGKIEGAGNWVRREMIKPAEEPPEPSAP